MTPDLLRQVGQALYGDQWQSSLARDLGVTSRTVRRWTDGTRGIPADMAERLLPLLSARAAQIDGLIGVLG